MRGKRCRREESIVTHYQSHGHYNLCRQWNAISSLCTHPVKVYKHDQDKMTAHAVYKVPLPNTQVGCIYECQKRQKKMIKSAGRYPAWELWKKHKRKNNSRWYISNGKVPSGNSLASFQHSEQNDKDTRKEGEERKDTGWYSMAWYDVPEQTVGISIPIQFHLMSIWGIWCMIYVPLRWIPTST